MRDGSPEVAPHLVRRGRSPEELRKHRARLKWGLALTILMNPNLRPMRKPRRSIKESVLNASKPKHLPVPILTGAAWHRPNPAIVQIMHLCLGPATLYVFNTTSSAGAKAIPLDCHVEVKRFRPTLNEQQLW